MSAKTQSILQTRRECYLCRELLFVRNTRNLQLHHVFPGARRQMSDKTGCVCWLCERHHTGEQGVHRHRALALWLMQRCQMEYMQRYGRRDFMEKFGKDFMDIPNADLKTEDIL